MGSAGALSKSSLKRPKRKAIPIRIKREVVARQSGLCACGCGADVVSRLCFEGEIPDIARGVNFDHRPPLGLRPVNAAGTDWEPPQHDPTYIEALATKACHDERTYKGRSGAS